MGQMANPVTRSVDGWCFSKSSADRQRSEQDESVASHSQLMLRPLKRLPSSGIFNSLALSTTLVMTVDPRTAASAITSAQSRVSNLPFPTLHLASPSSRHRCRSRCRWCLESLLPYASAVISSSPSSADVVWHIPPVPSSLHPHLLRYFTLASPSLLRHILLVSPSALSPNFPVPSPPLIPSLTSTTHTQLFKLSVSLLFFFLTSMLSPTSHPSISPRCFRDRDDLSCGDIKTERCSEAQEVLVVFGWRGRVTVTCSQPG